MRYVRAQFLLLVGPLRGDAAATDDAFGLHFEDIGEVAADGDLQVEADRLAAVVGDVEVFVHAAANGAAEHEAQGACAGTVPSSVRKSRLVRKMRAA